MSEVGHLDRGSRAYRKFSSIDQTVFMTMEEAEALSRDLANLILMRSGGPDLLVGPANGALVPTKTVADCLKVPFQIVRMRRRGSRYTQRVIAITKALGIPPSVFALPLLFPIRRYLQHRFSNLEQADNGFAFPVTGKTVVVIDDVVHTGKSARHLKQQLLNNGAASVLVAVLCWQASSASGDSGDWGPDIYLYRTYQLYPWSHNSPYFADFEAWLSPHGLTYWR